VLRVGVLNIGSIVCRLVGGGDAILTVIVGLIKNAMSGPRT
jgi:hypothetical protein